MGVATQFEIYLQSQTLILRLWLGLWRCEEWSFRDAERLDIQLFIIYIVFFLIIKVICIYCRKFGEYRKKFKSSSKIRCKRFVTFSFGYFDLYTYAHTFFTFNKIRILFLQNFYFSHEQFYVIKCPSKTQCLVLARQLRWLEPCPARRGCGFNRARRSINQRVRLWMQQQIHVFSFSLSLFPLPLALKSINP